MQEALRKKQELEARRASLIPMMATGKSFVSDEEAAVFDGLSPKDINQLAQSKLGGVGMTDDPFEVSTGIYQLETHHSLGLKSAGVLCAGCCSN